MFVLQVICYVIFVYGLLSLIQDIFNEVTYKKINHNMKIVIFAKELEENVDQFIIELYNMKRINPYKQIVVVDLEENDNINKIQERFQNNGVDIEVLNKEEGKRYIEKFTC